MLRQWSRRLGWLLFPFLIAGACGCAPIVVGLAVGAVGGYVVSPDTVEGNLNRSFDEVWESAGDITSIMGHIEEENERTGEIIARINGSRILVTMVSGSDRNTKLRVKARKAFMPKVDVAQEVYSKIVSGMDR